MRTLLKAQIPVETGNRAIKENLIGRVLERVMTDLKPESAYFYPDGGKRTMLFVFDLQSSADLPRVAEVFFTELEASIEVSPVMNFEDLKAGLGKLRSAT